MRRNFAIIVFVVIFLEFFVVFSAIQPTAVEARIPWGIKMGDSYIQVYVKDGEYENKIPQDQDMLKQDYFIIDMEIPDFDPRLIELEMFEKETINISTYDFKTQETITIQQTNYTKLVSSLTVQLQRGVNPYGDDRYAEKRIDSNIWFNLKPSDNEYLIKLTYAGEDYEFNKKTDYGLVPITKVRSSFERDIILSIVGAIFFAILGLPSGRFLYFKTGTLWPKFGFETIILILTYTVMVWYFGFIEPMGSAFDPLRELGSTPTIVFYLFIYFFFTMFTPGFFRPDEFGEIEINKVNLKYVDPMDIVELMEKGVINEKGDVIVENADTADRIYQIPTIKKEIVYSYQDRNGKTKYARDPDSVIDLITRLFGHGLDIDFKGSAVFDNENKKDKSYFVLDFWENNKTELLTENLRKLIYIVLISTIIVSFVLLLLREVSGLASVFIIALVLAGFLLIIFFLWDRFAEGYEIVIDPLRKNAFAIAVDATKANDMQMANDYLVAQNDQLNRTAKLTQWRRKGSTVFDWELEVWEPNFKSVFDQNLIDLWKEKTDPRKMKKKNGNKLSVEERKAEIIAEREKYLENQ